MVEMCLKAMMRMTMMMRLMMTIMARMMVMSLIMMVMMMTTTIFFGPRDDALDLIPSSIFSHTLGTPTVRVGLSWKISFLLQEGGC